MKSEKIIAAPLCAAMCVTAMLSGCKEVEEIPPGTTVYPDAGGSISRETSENAPAFDTGSYIYSMLSDKEKQYYDIISDAARNFEEKAEFPEKVDPEILRKLFISVYYQQEDIFWLSSMFYRPSEPADFLHLSYRFDKEKTRELEKEIEAKTGEIFSNFNENTSDYEKLRFFHDYLVLNCTFSKDTEYANTVYGALCDGYAQCEGYTFAFDYLCRKADIDCFSVSGTNPEGALHAWNYVRLEDMWYHVDCTWDDPILDPVDSEFIRYYYFLVSDTDILGVTHFCDTPYYAYPICTSGRNFYKREGYLADSADEGVKLMKKAAADARRIGRKDAAVRFESRRAYDSTADRLFESKEIRYVFAAANAGSDRKVTDRKYVRYFNDDELIIHISMIYE